MLRGLALGVVAVLASLLFSARAGAATAPPGPGEASGFFTFGGGQTLHGTGPVADLAAGFDVWVDARGAHVTQTSAAIQFAVGQLRRYGIDVRYRGVARPGERTTGTGTIDVTEAVGADPTSCKRPDSADSGLLTEAATFPNTQDVGVATRINSAQITFCPTVWSHGQHYVTAIALHEMGHAVGLGHYPDLFEGRTQLMNPFVPDLQSYQAGDVNGLRYVASRTALLRSQSTLSGAVESWRVTRRGLVVSGWAIIGRITEFADIAVTRDGATVYSITTNGARPDIAERYGAGWPNAGFSGSQIPMAAGTHEYCVVATAPTAPAKGDPLGCRSFAYPPPVPSNAHPDLPALGRAPLRVWSSSTGVRVGLGVGAGAVLLLVVVVGVRRARR